MATEGKSTSIDADVVRSARLNTEWARLRQELHTMDKTSPDYEACCAAIHKRMDEIKTEMTHVVSRSRRHVSPSTDHSVRLTYSADSKLHNHRSATNNHGAGSCRGVDGDDENLPPIVDGCEEKWKKPKQCRGDEEGEEEEAEDMAMASTCLYLSPSLEVDSHAASSSPKSLSSIPIQYSARRRHILRRTYDSTSSSDCDGPHSGDDHDTPDANQLDQMDVQSLRRQLMQGADIDTPIVTVEHRAHRGHLASFRRNLRNARKAPAEASGLPSVDSAVNRGVDAVDNLAWDAMLDDNVDAGGGKRTRSPSPPPAAPTPPSSVPDDDDLDDLAVPMSPPVSLTLEERETLNKEQSKLERESRRLKRKPNRSKVDDLRLQEIASHLSKLSSTLADVSMNVSIRQARSRPGGGKSSNSQHQRGVAEISHVSNGSDALATVPSASSSSGVKSGIPSTLSKGSSSNGGSGGGRLKSLLSPTGRPPPLHRAAGLTYPTEKSSEMDQQQQGHSGHIEKGGRLAPFGKGKSRVPTAPLPSTGGDSFIGTSSSPVTDDGKEHEGEDSASTPSKSSLAPSTLSVATPSGGRRRKPWQVIEASVKAFGRSMRNTALAARFDSLSGSNGGSAPPSGSHRAGTGDSVASHSYSNTTATSETVGTASASSSSAALSSPHQQRQQQSPMLHRNGRRASIGPRRRQSSAFADLGERLAKREERLHATADASDRMANDADDMLSAARALRQRQQKGLFS